MSQQIKLHLTGFGSIKSVLKSDKAVVDKEYEHIRSYSLSDLANLLFVSRQRGNLLKLRKQIKEQKNKETWIIRVDKGRK